MNNNDDDDDDDYDDDEYDNEDLHANIWSCTLLCSEYMFCGAVCRGYVINSFESNIQHDRKVGNLRSVRNYLLIHIRNLPNHAQVSASAYILYQQQLSSCLDPRLTHCAWAEAYLPTKWHLDPSSRLATIQYTNVRDRTDRQTENGPIA